MLPELKARALKMGIHPDAIAEIENAGTGDQYLGGFSAHKFFEGSEEELLDASLHFEQIAFSGVLQTVEMALEVLMYSRQVLDRKLVKPFLK